MRVSLKFLALFAASTALPVSSQAQSGWFWQNPLPQGNTLRAVVRLDPITVVVADDYGTILSTTDGGATRTPQSGETTATLRGISFVDANTGWAVGGGGTILHTTTGGE